MDGWEMVSRVPRLHKARCGLYVDSTVLLLGHYRSLDALMNKDPSQRRMSKKAFVIRGEAELAKWKKVFEFKGELCAVSHNNGVVCALGRELLADRSYQAYLVMSTNAGASWGAPLEPPAGDLFGVAIVEGGHGYAWSPNKIFHKERIGDASLTWDRIELSDRAAGVITHVAAAGGGHEVWLMVGDAMACLGRGALSAIEEAPLASKTCALALDDSGALWKLVKDGALMVMRRKAPAEYDEVARVHAVTTVQYFGVHADRFVLVGMDAEGATPTQVVISGEVESGRWTMEALPNINLRAMFMQDANFLWGYGAGDQLLRKMF